MLKKLFAAGAALIFLTTASMAASECIKLDEVKSTVEHDNIGLKYVKDITSTDPTVIKSFLETLFKYTGPGPFKIEDVKSLVVSVPEDAAKWKQMVGFYDKDGCKLAYIGIATSDLGKIIKEAGGVSGTES